MRWVVVALLGLGVVHSIACSDDASALTDAGPDSDAAPRDAGGVDGGGPPPNPHFTDVTAEAGIGYVQQAFVPYSECVDQGATSLTCVTKILTGGATVGDFDGDGWDDLFVARLDGTDILYRNRGDGTFEDASASAGITEDLPTNGVAFGDIDDDGDLDLFETTVGAKRDLLYVNQGDGTFTEAATARGVDLDDGSDHLGMSACFGDYDLDGWLDLHVNEWAPLKLPGEPDSQTVLLHNQGAPSPGHFEDVTAAAGVDMAALVTGYGVSGFSSVFADMNADGAPDLVVMADYGQTHLFWNDGDGTFTDGTPTLGAGVPTDENGMGFAIGDIDQDGAYDWFVTSIFDDRFPCMDCEWGFSGNRLYHNLGDGTFEDATDTWGVRQGGWGWGTRLFDYDNDGDLDLVMTNGYTIDLPQAEVFYQDPMRLWRNDGAPPFVEVSEQAGLTNTDSGKALLVFDYDHDGDLDLFVVNNAAEPVLYRNDGPVGHWLRVRVEGAGATGGGSNREGIGAQVAVTVRPGDPPQVRQVLGGCGYLGQSENVLHFGLGAAETVTTVRVRWPASGQTRTFTDVAADQVLVASEPSP